MTDDPLRIARRIGHVLDDLGVPYVVGGSLASSMHGMPRATQDVDVVVSMSPSAARRLEASAVGFIVDAESLEQSFRRGQSYNVFDEATMTKIDLFPAKGRFERNQLARAVRLSDLRVLAPEDAILAKLRWFRLGGEISDRQWRDILGILQVQAADLDWEHLREWAAELAVSDLLERARSEQGLEG